ncbi:hypothetical protein PybrP1_008389 [[Pythium] brassicae (nom. inval.)]|nr:hypothetical protein PybrP1_008389 [[Pythium] brassicae (nom. inval.)]
MASPSSSLQRELHTSFFIKHLRALPPPYASQDVNRVVLAYFCVHGLAVLGELERVDKRRIIEWVYSLQVHPDKNDRSVNASDCGFRGGPFMGNVFACDPAEYTSEQFDTASIAATYAALCILRTLGDDLGRVNKPAVTGALRHLQNKHTGSFSSLPYGSEEDMRFVYCACAISYILDDWSGVDTAAMVRYVNSCLTYDGAIGIAPETESHAGAVFCAVAALVLAGRVMQLGMDQAELVRWLVFRQQGGFQGRCNKDPDTCYAFWNGATLDLLGQHALVDIPSCRDFVYACQFPFGGIAKYPDTTPDVMHAYYSLAWLSIASNSQRRGASGSDGGRDALPELAPLDTKLQVPHFPALSPPKK